MHCNTRTMHALHMGDLTCMPEYHKHHGAGAHVLDLGCAPGAWLQVACQALGPPQKRGCVVGVDLQVSVKMLLP